MKTVTLFLILVAGLLHHGCSETTPQAADTNTAPQDASPEQAAPATIVEVSFNDATAPNQQTTKVSTWPHWLGPNYNGISAETDWRADWTDKPPQVLWRGNVGTGYSSIAVADGRLYTMGHKAGNETVSCLDAETGQEIWKQSYPAQLVNHLNAGGPGATPTIDGEFLFTNSRDGRLICFDIKTGKIIWQKELTKAYQMKVPEWGFTCSPLIRGDKLFIY